MNKLLIIFCPCLGLPPENQIHQPILVTTAHIHWDPEFCDVKLIQTMMLMAELKNIVKETTTKFRPGGGSNTNSLPLILCGDLNSLPDSGQSLSVTSSVYANRVATHLQIWEFREKSGGICEKVREKSGKFMKNFLKSAGESQGKIKLLCKFLRKC